MAEARNEEIKKIVMQWLTEFSLPLDDDAAHQSIASVCSPNIVWTDHAFHIQRTGHAAVAGLRKAFNHCNQPFEASLKKIHYTSDGAVVEVVWIGNCKNDIVRPNGDVAVKANGRDFRCHVCFVMEIDPVDKITRIDEYYNKAWWDAVPVEEYHQITGASLKT